MTTLVSVKVTREKLVELLTTAKQEAIAKNEQQITDYDAEVERLLGELSTAASKDLKKEANVDALSSALGAYKIKKTDRKYRLRDRKTIEQRYDNALRLVEISSDDMFKISSSTEFGQLLGL